jgi:hypothetical protein
MTTWWLVALVPVVPVAVAVLTVLVVVAAVVELTLSTTAAGPMAANSSRDGKRRAGGTRQQ